MTWPVAFFPELTYHCMQFILQLGFKSSCCKVHLALQEDTLHSSRRELSDCLPVCTVSAGTGWLCAFGTWQ